MTAKTTKTTTEKQADLSVCGCGCGETTKATYRPGHDARHAGQIGRDLAVNPKDRAALAALNGLSPALRAKAERVRDNAVAKTKKDTK